MYISKIILQNWKNFPDVEVDLTQRTFIIGANASGKSNFLDAIRFLRDITKQGGGLQVAVNQRGGIKKIRCLSAKQNPDISFQINLSNSLTNELEWTYILTFGSNNHGKNDAIIFEEIVRNEKDKKEILSRNRMKEYKSEDEDTLKFSHLEQITANAEFRPVYNFFNNIEYLNIVPLLVRESNTYMSLNQQEDYYGKSFLNRISKLIQKTRDSYLKKINEVLKIAVPQFQELKFIKDDNGIPHLEVIYSYWRSKGNKQHEDQFSDGTLRLIDFLWAMLDGNETIMLEEPEINLHTEIIKQLPEFITKLQKKKGKKRQVIITTHSYDLLNTDTIGLDEVLILTSTNNGTKIEKASSIEQIRKTFEAGFSIAEATYPITAPENITKLSELELK